MTFAKRKVGVVGAGWAGCAAAAELARQGHQVSLYESASVLGGRARGVDFAGRKLDNGQHILLGAYTETLRLMRMVGVDTDQTLLRLPLQMRYPKDSGGMDFIAARLPAPLHLLVALGRSSGLGGADKLALARFSTTARWMEWQLHTDCSVSELLGRFDQTERMTKLMWRPLCIASLNTPPERASAQVFLNVLRDSLGARRAASDMLIPKTDLSALFPQQAAAFVERHGGQVKCGMTVKKIMQDDTGWKVEAGGEAAGDGNAVGFDMLVIATQPAQAVKLLERLPQAKTGNTFQYEPITTCYLQYTPETCLTQPFFALIDDAANQHWGQFVFDRGQLDAGQAGLFSVVISASSEAVALDQDVLGRAVAAQLAKVFRAPHLAQPQWTRVISEKRATFSCSPGLARPANATGIANLVIAGDYTACDYPATLEAAVRSGVLAAGLLA